MSKIKKIALLIIDLKIGGAEKSTVLLAEMLQETGYEVLLITINEIIDFETKIPIVSLRSSRIFLFNKVSKLVQLRKCLHQNKIDLVIDNRNKKSIIKEFFYFLSYLGYKKIYVVRSFFIDNYVCKNSWLSRSLFKKVNHFVVVSKEIKELLSSRIPNNQITTIYNFVPDYPITEFKKPIEKKYILFFGRFDNSSKDLVFLLNAFKASELWNKGVNLLMLGKGEDKTLILKTINQLKIDEYVDIVEANPHPEIYIKSALFTVMTSNYEGFPRGMIESLSLGIPVVTTDFKSGSREIIKNRVNGLIVSKNIQEYASALNEMIDNDTLYKNCVHNAVSSVSHLSKQNIALQWKKLIDKI